MQTKIWQTIDGPMRGVSWWQGTTDLVDQYLDVDGPGYRRIPSAWVHRHYLHDLAEIALRQKLPDHEPNREFLGGGIARGLPTVECIGHRFVGGTF